MRPVGNGRPGTEVFPDDWQATHAAVVGTTFDSTIRIAPAGTNPQWDEEAGGTRTTAGTPIYSGGATITAISDSDRTVDVVEEQAALRRYEVKVEVDLADVDPDVHFVYVDACRDSDLAGKRLSIESVKRGDRRFSRVLYAVLND
jgi:hypothetical protein